MFQQADLVALAVGNVEGASCFLSAPPIVCVPLAGAYMLCGEAVGLIDPTPDKVLSAGAGVFGLVTLGLPSRTIPFHTRAARGASIAVLAMGLTAATRVNPFRN